MPIRELLQTGLLTSKQMQSETGQSQAIISRELKALDEDVVRITKGRSVNYTLAVSSFGVSNSIPISLHVHRYSSFRVLSVQCHLCSRTVNRALLLISQGTCRR